ncbi:MAG: substrate-binding domain-containing protein [Proteobacteria bacterium]|nr:substrate-binding domain-containing protein [Pseudomonadota bacterium]
MVLCLLSPAGSFAATLKIGGTGAALGTMRVLADAFMQSRPNISIEIPSSLGSSGGIQAVGAGALDIGLSSRPLKNKERKAGLKQTTFARSPFMFVTSNGHADPSLTLTELVAIYSGDQAYWSDGARIRLVLRPETDTDTTILESSIDGMGTALAKARETPGVPVAYTDQDAMEMAERIPGALTTATLTSILTEHRSLMPISIDGVAPTVDNLANGSYRMSKTLYFVTGPKVSSIALDFIRFVQSAAGASILSDTGNLMIAAEG